MSYLKANRPWWIVLLFGAFGCGGCCGGCGSGSKARNHPVFVAANSGNVEAVRQALDEDPTLIEATYLAPWSMSGSDPVLGHRGQGPHASKDTGLTLAHIAAGSGKLEVVKLLAERGADLDVKGGPIRAAATNRHRAVVAFLLEKGVDINQSAVLHIAVRNLDLELVELLLEKKANPNQVREKSSEQTPLHAITAANGDPAQSSEKHAQVRAVIFERLVKAGGDVNAKDHAGATPLHRATLAYLYPRELVDLLLKNGADVNARDNRQATPLHVSAGENGGSDMRGVIKTLLAHKADVTAKNDQGQTPIELLAERMKYSEPKEREAIADLLIAHGASRELWEKAKREFEKKKKQ